MSATIKRSKFEASEIDIIARIRNELLLLSNDTNTPRHISEILRAQGLLLQKIGLAHGKGPTPSKILHDGVLHEWPVYKRERWECHK